MNEFERKYNVLKEHPLSVVNENLDIYTNRYSRFMDVLERRKKSGVESPSLMVAIVNCLESEIVVRTRRIELKHT